MKSAIPAVRLLQFAVTAALTRSMAACVAFWTLSLAQLAALRVDGLLFLTYLNRNWVNRGVWVTAWELFHVFYVNLHLCNLHHHLFKLVTLFLPLNKSGNPFHTHHHLNLSFGFNHYVNTHKLKHALNGLYAVVSRSKIVRYSNYRTTTSALKWRWTQQDQSAHCKGLPC